jgi:predicted RNA-binding Zn ribbon-like protein
VPGETAPGDLELVRSLLNTLDVERGEDHLARWLGAPVPPRDLRRLTGLRETLRDALDPAHPHRPAALDRLNALLRSARAYPQLGPDGGLTVTFPPGGAPPRLAAILGAVVTASLDGTLRRLKICANPDCRWAFYDPSRNTSGRWCDMAVCGNRAKVRKYRLIVRQGG